MTLVHRRSPLNLQSSLNVHRHFIINVPCSYKILSYFCTIRVDRLIYNVENTLAFYLTVLNVDLCISFQYIHSVGVIHRDLKPSNLAVNEDCELRVKYDIYIDIYNCFYLL